MENFTAADARKLAGPTAQEEVDVIIPLIKEAAKKKERKLCLHQDFWVNEAYSQTPKYKEAQKILESLGFKVEFYYEEKQFVNMFTIVKW